MHNLSWQMLPQNPVELPTNFLFQLIKGSNPYNGTKLDEIELHLLYCVFLNMIICLSIVLCVQCVL